MEHFKIEVSGSGTTNQLAIRLLEIGRALQVHEYNEGNTVELLQKLNEEDDGILTIKIEED
jgi:hypothetical protein